MGFNDHFTNRRGLNVIDLSIADDGNDLKFSIATKIIDLYGSLVYNYRMNYRRKSDNRSAAAAWVRPMWYLKNAANYMK